MSHERRIAEFADYDGLIEALRQRLVEINITHATFERLAGWPAGLCGKVFGDAQVKKLGPRNLAEAFEVLAIKAVLVEDTEAATRMADRWEERVRADYNANRLAKVGLTQINRMVSPVARELGKRGGKARFAKMTKRQIRAHQQRAAKARRGPRRRLSAVKSPPPVVHADRV